MTLKPQHMSPTRVAWRVEEAAEKVREASDLINEVIRGADSETARLLCRLAAGITDAKANLLQAFAHEQDAKAEASLSDDEPVFPLGFDTGLAEHAVLRPALRAVERDNLNHGGRT